MNNNDKNTETLKTLCIRWTDGFYEENPVTEVRFSLVLNNLNKEN
jgi:hypothetical protein